MGLIYQEVCCSNISSSIFKDMKIDIRNKRRKIVSLILDKSLIDAAIDKVILVVGLDENSILVTITVRVIFYI